MDSSVSFVRTRASVKTSVAVLLVVALATTSTLLLRGSMPDIQTGTWTATGSLPGIRSGAASVLMPDGRVLVSGGFDGATAVAAAASFESDGTFSAAAAMHASRADHSAVLLTTGQVLVAGGRNESGAVASAEILVDGEWLAAGALTDARWGHTATLLGDGRVLIAGGENASGPVGSIEIFDPATGQVTVAGTLVVARKGHAAVRLGDGRVLIAGGSSAIGPLNSTEIVDAATQSITSGPPLISKRVGLSATTLLDGKVLLLGGNNGTSNLASAELFNPATGTIAPTASAAVARRDHQAFLLPNNNAVLIVGGIADVTVGGVTTTEPTPRAELFLPWLPAVWQTGAVSAPRVKATGSVLSVETYGPAPGGDGLLMVAGGEGSSGSEAYRFATIRTDKDDYLPGQTVYVSGSGWQPDEIVTFGLRELPAEHEARTFQIRADETGSIDTKVLFVVEPHHLGVKFDLTGRGAASQAQLVFTDGNLQAVSLTPTSRSVTAGVDAVYTTNVDMGGNTATCTVTLSVPTSLPSGATASFDNNPITAGNVDFTRTLTISTTLATPAGTYPFTVLASGPACQGSGSALTTGSLTVTAATTTTTSAAAATATFSTSAQTVPLSATITPASVNAGTVTFTVRNGLNEVIGSPVTSGTVASGSAGASFLLPASTPAGSYTITAEYSGGDGFAASSGTSTLTVGKANQTITFAAPVSPAAYNTTFAVSATSSSSLTVIIAATGVCSIASPNVTMTSGTGTCTLTASHAGDANYNAATDVVRTVTAAKASQTITFAQPASPATYYSTFAVSPTTDSPLTVSVAASGACSIAGTIVSMNSGTGTCTLTASQAGDSNYSAATDVVRAVAATKANAILSVTGHSGVYDGNSHGATGTAVGIEEIAADLNALLHLGASFTNVPGGTANWTFDGSSNYNAANGTAEIVLTKANAVISVTGFTGVYSGQPHGATGTAVGVESTPVDLSGLLHLGDSFTTVPGGTATWTFDGNGNYNPASGTAAIVISKADPTIVVDGYTGIYDGNPHGATGTATGVKTEALTGLSLGSSFTNVPGGTANWTFTDTTGNYNDKSGTAAVVINKKAASVTANGKTKIYGAVNPALDAAVAGTVAGDPLSYSLATTATQLSSMGSYPITVTLGANPNYDVTPTNAALAITPKAASVTANNKSKTYGEANPALDAVVSGTVPGGDTLNYTLATPATTTSGIGPYPINVTLGANPNYTVTPTVGTLTINAKALTITAKDATKILGATLTFAGTEFTSSGLVNGDTVASVTLTSTGAAPGAAIGSYPIVPSAAAGTTIGNYAITYKNGTVKVQYLWDGFLQPINDTAHDAHQTAPYSTFKTGQTIPAKFELKNANGQIVTQVGNPIFNRTGNLGACSAIAGLEPDDLAVAPDTDGVYKPTGSQYNYGWSTKGLTQGLYMIFANLADGTSRSVYICLTK